LRWTIHNVEVQWAWRQSEKEESLDFWRSEQIACSCPFALTTRGQERPFGRLFRQMLLPRLCCTLMAGEPIDGCLNWDMATDHSKNYVDPSDRSLHKSNRMALEQV